MTSGKSNIVDVALEKKMTKGGGTAFSQGDKDENGREVWIWIPTSQVEDNGDGTFAMPEWLAKDKGLI